MSAWICLPEIYVTRRQPLQSGYIQDRELVPCQTESLHASELLQDGGDAAEAVEGQAEVGQALQRAQLHGQRAQEVTVQEKSLQAGHGNKRRAGKRVMMMFKNESLNSHLYFSGGSVTKKGASSLINESAVTTSSTLVSGGCEFMLQTNKLQHPISPWVGNENSF